MTKISSMNRHGCPSWSLVVLFLLLLPLFSGASSSTTGTTTSSRDDDEKHQYHIGDMECHFLEQPLNHFHVPKEESPTYRQRYCIYNKFVVMTSTAPVFFYTGNESPLEQYINHTGLMWELAPVFGAEIVFVEHRYEGQSLPAFDIPHCLAYSSSKQAIEDYARFLEYHQFLNTTTTTASIRRPVIAFGGSYGGMLAACFRMKYPSLVTGAIAASAPIWALPRTNPTMIDGAYRVLQRGLQLPYPPTSKASPTTENHCATNLLATWPLLQYLFSHANGSRDHLTDWFRLCRPLGSHDLGHLTAWIRSPWFDLAEGSFPYPSSYIPFALLPEKYDKHGNLLKLPPWPTQAACWKFSQLHRDWGIRIHGNLSNVRYNISYALDSTTTKNLTLAIDWDQMTIVHNDDRHQDTMQVLESPQIQGLLTSVRDAVAVWYNITHEEPCFNLTPANNINNNDSNRRGGLLQQHRKRGLYHGTDSLALKDRRNLRDRKNATEQCRERIQPDAASWPALCCNEEMNMIITEAIGLGRDMFWPPNYPRGTRSHADVIRHDNHNDNNKGPPSFCLDPQGIFGYSQLPADPWSIRLDTYYGGTRIANNAYSNIVFSNGLLDPWMAGGVNVPDISSSSELPMYDGPMVRPIGKDMIALIIEFGGHHTDLMYSNEKDPECVTKAREIEKQYIAKWIAQAQNSNDDHQEEL
ncbi:Lysosomal Pro-X carboxypeptidase [Seminavis robusta]|uniref:Lysosomal Pro-X carboxypeptidase n=1 Tax=Seminavis robusta TaxID=568900 RepID=A0A9N8HEY0_9STRA|nr:Lysosomal Pro-X carboxypeptidase [Seminavis robusta]|eukprot:Sro431_g141510.1 Lysosomal Pro-X carboxypeptidase (695) ;mRNA; r:51065-53149